MLIYNAVLLTPIFGHPLTLTDRRFQFISTRHNRWTLKTSIIINNNLIAYKNFLPIRTFYFVHHNN